VEAKIQQKIWSCFTQNAIDKRIAKSWRLGNRAAQAAFEWLERNKAKVCAAERAAESLAQPEEARRDASGPSDLPENESWRGKEHIGEAGVTGRRRKCRPARPVRYGES
jgi:hypothetical protein